MIRSHTHYTFEAKENKSTGTWKIVKHKWLKTPRSKDSTYLGKSTVEKNLTKDEMERLLYIYERTN